MQAILAFIGKFIMEKLTKWAVSFGAYTIKVIKMKKKVTAKIKEIKSDPDRKSRVKRMFDFLSR